MQKEASKEQEILNEQFEIIKSSLITISNEEKLKKKKKEIEIEKLQIKKKQLEDRKEKLVQIIKDKEAIEQAANEMLVRQEKEQLFRQKMGNALKEIMEVKVKYSVACYFILIYIHFVTL